MQEVKTYQIKCHWYDRAHTKEGELKDYDEYCDEMGAKEGFKPAFRITPKHGKKENWSPYYSARTSTGEYNGSWTGFFVKDELGAVKGLAIDDDTKQMHILIGTMLDGVGIQINKIPVKGNMSREEYFRKDILRFNGYCNENGIKDNYYGSLFFQMNYANKLYKENPNRFCIGRFRCDVKEQTLTQKQIDRIDEEIEKSISQLDSFDEKSVLYYQYFDEGMWQVEGSTRKEGITQYINFLQQVQKGSSQSIKSIIEEYFPDDLIKNR